ncbi:MAG: flavin oxidoreductase/NADH oxidase [Oscillospiraceae bacterium]|nr:flavin oxidoreductase/NADH oxidase [Oscillospiraceae bacterium]
MQKFNYKSMEALRADILSQGLELDVSDDVSALLQKVSLPGISICNSMAVLPMEGCDGDEYGAPGELTIRRYLRFARGGAGIVWFEAIAVVPEGRGNPRQLCINEKTAEAFAGLLRRMRAAARESGREPPFIIAQLTHAGRYARPRGAPEPVTAQRHPLLDEKYRNTPPRIIADEELPLLEDAFAKAAALAGQAGFDAVDVKACHRYLISDFFSAYDRPGLYGGSYENRARLFLNIIDRINALPSPIAITPRINAYDALPYPLGFGSDEKNRPFLIEPLKLLADMKLRGVKMANISCGNPYYNPHVGRPFDNGPYMPPESQLKLSARMLNIISEMQRSQPRMAIVCTGLSWFRQFGANVAAAGIKNGCWTIAGFGRQSLAYPDFAADIINLGGMKPEKCCAACSGCTQIMRDGGSAGCTVRDGEIYLPILKKGRAGRPVPTPQTLCDHII